MEPITTALIVGFLADKVLGTATEKYTESALEKINQLTTTVWERLRSRNSKAEKAIASFEQKDLSVQPKLETYLDDEMEEDKEFRALVEALAREIGAGKKQVQGGGIHQDISGENAKGVAFSNANTGGENQSAETIYNNTYYTNPPH